jgi:hypothetical protein
MRNDLEKREKYEWCNTWWEDANDRSKPRVLLIGDSIAVGYRPYVSEMLKAYARVDMYASSRGLDDPAYEKELLLLLSEYAYSVIHFNNGLHGMHLSQEEYRRDLEGALRVILLAQPGAKIIAATSTPVTLDGQPGELNDKVNANVVKRNVAVIEAAEKLGIEVNDLYGPMLGRSEYRLPDGYHYNADGQKRQAERVAGAIKRAMAEIAL